MGNSSSKQRLSARKRACAASSTVSSLEPCFIIDDSATAWLPGPGPMNYWRTMLSRTVADLNEANKVHIMVVNSENAYTLQETVSGVHWFVVAWFVAPPPAPEL